MGSAVKRFSQWLNEGRNKEILRKDLWRTIDVVSQIAQDFQDEGHRDVADKVQQLVKSLEDDARGRGEPFKSVNIWHDLKDSGDPVEFEAAKRITDQLAGHFWRPTDIDKGLGPKDSDPPGPGVRPRR